MRRFSLNATRVLIILILILLFSFRRDGIQPFSPDTNPTIVAWIEFFQAVLIAILLFFFFFPERLRPHQRFFSLIRKNLYPIVVVTTVSLVLLIALFHTYYSIFNSSYSHFYKLNLPVTIALVLVSLLSIVTPLILKNARWSVIGLLIGNVMLSLIPILYFPITAKLSDLMPIIDKQLEAFISGQSIYQYFLLDNGVLTQAVRQPGTTLSYLPAFLLGTDLRFMSILFTTLTGVVLVKVFATRWKSLKHNQNFLLFYLCLALFLLFPYRHIRHDLYEPVYWFLVVLSLYFLEKRRLWIFAVCWGLSIFTQVWSWIFSPFISLYLLKKYGWKQALIYSCMYLMIGVGLLLLFIYPDPSAYHEHVFGFYQKTKELSEYAASTIHITPLIQVYGLKELLLPIQILLSAIVGLISIWKMKNFKYLLISLSIVFFVFIQFNILSWNYMYLTLIVLMVYLAVREMRLSSKAQDNSRKKDPCKTD